VEFVPNSYELESLLKSTPEVLCSYEASALQFFHLSYEVQTDPVIWFKLIQSSGSI